MKRLAFILLIAAIATSAMAADLTGTWVLNAKESDMPERPMMRQGMPPGGGGPGFGPGRGMRGPGGGAGGPGGGPGFGPPRGQAERFSIEQNGEAVVFHYNDGWSRTLRPGETAKWEGSKFVTTRTPGPKIVETYEVSPDRKRLTITTFVTPPEGEPRTIKRVYDAAK